jgi:hypothetical protein
MNAAPRMLPKQTEFASNPLLNKRTNQANQKKEEGNISYVWLSNTKSNPATILFFSFLFYKFRQSLHLLELSIGPPPSLSAQELRRRRRRRRPRGLHYFLAAKTMIVRKGDKVRRVAREPTRKRQVNRRIRGQQTTVRVM